MRKTGGEKSSVTAADVAVSGIIPTVGRPDYLRKCLETVARQTLVPREVLIVHCGDDPETQAVAADSAWPAAGFEVRYFKYPERNAAAQRNFAVAHARHQWLLLLDDDLELEPGWTEELLRPMLCDSAVVATLGRLTNQPYSVCGSRWWGLYHRFAVGRSPYRNQGRLVGAAVNIGFVGTPPDPVPIEWIGGGASAVRRSSFERVGGFASYFSGASPGEDLDLGYRLCLLGRVLFVPTAAAFHHSAGHGREPGRDYHRNVIHSKFATQLRAMGKRRGTAWLHAAVWAAFQTVSELVSTVRRRGVRPWQQIAGRASGLASCLTWDPPK